jgi:cobalt/nickel transport system permease protein
MAPPLDPRSSRALLGAWLVSVFALSATADLRVLGGAAAAAVIGFRRGLGRAARRLLVSVVPVTAALSAVSWGWLRLVSGRAPAAAPYLALSLRAVLIAFVTLSVLARVDLLRALAPWPSATRLLVVTLAQIHALRLLATESLLGLRSRMPVKPGTVDLVRGAGGITATLFTLSSRNARDISEAMRSRGFR